MPTTTYNYWFDTTPTTGEAVGAIAFGAGNKLCGFRAKGTIAWPTATAGSGDFNVYPVQIGIQAIDTGDTPIQLPVDLSDDRWLVVDQIEPVSLVVSWAPSTDTPAYISSIGFEIEWTGQRVYSSATTVYLTTGSTYGPAPAWYSEGTTRLLLA